VGDLVVGVVAEHPADVDAAVSQLRSGAGRARVSRLLAADLTTPPLGSR
jgi:hypothetical protein